jgi:hypothetical protein
MLKNARGMIRDIQAKLRRSLVDESGTLGTQMWSAVYQ